MRDNTKSTSETTNNPGPIRQCAEYDGHEFVVMLDDAASGLHAYVAVHSTKLGLAHGGTRMKVYACDEDALKDALNLSRAMSYKSALAGLPYGGAKGVIVIGDGEFDRGVLLKAYAEKLEALGGLFRTGTDVGLTDEDIAHMAMYSRFMLGLSGGGKGALTTAKAAAMGVANAIGAAVRYRYDREDLTGLTVGVKGVGKLGAELAAILTEKGAHIYVADLDRQKAERVRSSYPSSVTVVEVSEIHKQKLNVYAPCALGAEFSPAVIRELACDIVAGGANNQLPDEEAGDALFHRGILYVPDFIANAGGLIFVSEDLEPDGFHAERVAARLEAIKSTLEIVFQRSDQERLPTHRVANMIAKERIGRT